MPVTKKQRKSSRQRNMSSIAGPATGPSYTADDKGNTRVPANRCAARQERSLNKRAYGDMVRDVAKNARTSRLKKKRKAIKKIARETKRANRLLLAA